MKAPFIFLLVGLVLLWAGVTGRLGVILAALFTPREVMPSDPNLPLNGGYTNNPGGR
jgi:hypothetical protein